MAPTRNARHACASDLDDWFFCHKKVALRQVLGDVETPAATRGTAIHAAIESKAAKVATRTVTVEQAIANHALGVPLVSSETPLFSKRLGLRGIVDLIIWERGPVEVFEFKSGSGPSGLCYDFGARAWISHAAQLVAYGLLVEESLRTELRLRLVYDAASLKTRLQTLRGNGRSAFRTLRASLRRTSSVEVPFNPSTKARVENVLPLIRRAKSGQVSPARSHGSSRKCASCCYRTDCDESLAR